MSGLTNSIGIPYATANTSNTLVSRDVSGNFSAGTITANLSGTATNATNVATSVTSSGVFFYPLFVSSSSSGNQSTQLNSDLAFNPGSGQLVTLLCSLQGSSGSNTIFNLGSASSALTGTTYAQLFSGNLAAGNYINFGTNGRNLGVFQGGNFFHSMGLDYNATSNNYVYANSGTGTGLSLELTTSGGFNFNTAPSGTNGAAATMTTQFSISNNGSVSARGNIDITVAGEGLRVAEGTNAKQGLVTLSGGTLVVSNTSVTANSRIFLMCQVPGGTPGFLRVSARTAGTSFTILSSNILDASEVAYEIFEPG